MGTHNNLQTQDEITIYLTEHIPYRLRILTAHKNLCKSPYNGDKAILEACFEASLVTGRLLLNMLGIGKSSGYLAVPRYLASDINAIDLGLNLIDIGKLSDEDKGDFLTFIIIADRASAHLTSQEVHDTSRLHIIIEKIASLVKTSIYSPL